MENETTSEAPAARQPRRGRPSMEKLLRDMRKEFEAEKRARADEKREFEETLALMKDLLLKQVDGAEAEKQSAGLTEANVLAMIRAHSRGDDRRPDYYPLTGKEREELDAIDPLCWIDESTDVVHLVARTALLTLRNRHVTQQGVVVKKLRLTKRLSAKWENCPYIFGGKTPGDADSNALHNSIWHFFELTARDAREMWMGRDPFPLEVVVRLEDLEEARATGEVFGKKRKSSGIAMREGVRKLLQSNAQVVWLNTDIYSPNWDGRYWYHPYNLPQEKYPRKVHRFIDPREPNPYSTGCPGATAGPRGGVLVPLGPGGEAGQMLNLGPSASGDLRTLLRGDLAEHVNRGG